jgi:hypothetical protein
MLRTVINKYTGKEHRAQFHDLISEDEMLIDTLRTEDMENPYWSFTENKFYDKIEE